ncbi:unnamed protein product [Phytophthora lilii]|uniref:Unnamed protein product n=1 Tax=Phytophthora lilii TaxID=2077276 RepID=A0A9W6WPK0_9STRA|nr:unnamed protein product [Phytophthora lilii]
MDQQETSAAQAFFLTHKDLFQYEKYVGDHSPFQTAAEGNSDGQIAKSFLCQYREVDRGRASVPALAELHFSLLHPLVQPFPVSNVTASTTTPVSLPVCINLQSTSAILEKFTDHQHDPTRSHAVVSSPQRMIHLTQPSSPVRTTNDRMLPPQDPNSDHTFASLKKDVLSQSYSHQLQGSPARFPVEPRQNFSLPKLAELLIDRETRAAVTAHKSWDATHKIEILIGGKCVGRVSAASRNIPPSIRSRLRASANISVRRERLYDLLCRDYDEISKRHTQ